MLTQYQLSTAAGNRALLVPLTLRQASWTSENCVFMLSLHRRWGLLWLRLFLVTCCHATVWYSHVGSPLKCSHFSDCTDAFKLTYYGKALPTPSEQETDLSWFSSDYQNHLIWEKDNQNEILHDNQKIWSCNAALWKKEKKKKKAREKEKTEPFISLHHTGEFRARELCIWVSWVLKENSYAVFSTHFHLGLLKMPNLKGANINKK